MKRLPIIGSVTLMSGLLFSVIMANQLIAQQSTAQESRDGLQATQPSQVPARHTLRQLKAAGKSLIYFPKMKRAATTSYPEITKSDRVFEGAEITLFGAGPLRIGMTLEEATNALGIPLTPLGSNLSGECAYYQPDTSAQTLGLMVVDNSLIRLDIWPGSTLPTVSGAKIGSSETEIMELYPEQIEVAPNPYTKGKFLTLVPNDPQLSLYRLVFETDENGKVVQYRTGQFPAVTWPDGCI
ncbi:MAG: hypothetical protein AAFQ89_13525 [Cyanobacteria bacterium J06626_18]